MSRHPEVLWAQRSNKDVEEKNVIYLTVNLPNIDPSTLAYNLSPTSLSFKAKNAEQAEYAFDLDLFAEVDPEKSTKRLTSRSFIAVLRKKELKSEYWQRLTKEKIKTPFIKTDFSKWADEDEQDEKIDSDDDKVGGFPGMDTGDFDFSKMSDLNVSPSGTGGPVEDVDEESDDDVPPPLEEPKPAK